MNLRNTPCSYGSIAILLHWAVALLVIGLIPLGLWMTGLDYYHPWYRQGPDLPMLEWADEAVAVNPTARLARVAAERGWRVEKW